MDAPLRTEVDGRPLSLSNLDKPLFPDGFTKAEVIDYYSRIAPVLLPHLDRRCLTRIRFPNGSDGQSFFEKNLPNGAPEWVSHQLVTATDALIDYPVADSVATLVWLANLAALELHTPQWSIDSAPHADGEPLDLADTRSHLVMVDLDPGPNITRVQLAEAAMIIATALSGDGLMPYVKTSGSKGLQVVAPIQPVPGEQVTGYVLGLARSLTQQHPERFVATMAKQQRVDRIYIDYLQNQAARNTIAPYSLRARDRAMVATPVTWEEVAAVRGEDDLRFDAAQVLRRVDEFGDLWADLTDPTHRAALP